MDLSNPSSLFLRPGMAEVLRVLAGTTSPLTGRTVARLSGTSHAGAAKVLVKLVRHGVVDSQHAGSANLYRLNRDHLLVAPLLVLLRASERLEASLAAELRSWTVPCDGAVLFGSAARRDGGAGSDVDILLIRPKGVEMADEVWRDQREGAAAKVHGWTDGGSSGHPRLCGRSLDYVRFRNEGSLPCRPRTRGAARSAAGSTRVGEEQAVRCDAGSRHVVAVMAHGR